MSRSVEQLAVRRASGVSGAGTLGSNGTISSTFSTNNAFSASVNEIQQITKVGKTNLEGGVEITS